jgi:hypothetical protein
MMVEQGLDLNGKNGKWQITTVILSIFVSIFLLGIVPAIVTNDRLSRERDENITKSMNNQYSDIVQRLARIETKLEK